MGFTKFTVSEKVTIASEKDKQKIAATLKTAGKSSVDELTDEEKEKLDIYLSES